MQVPQGKKITMNINKNIFPRIILILISIKKLYLELKKITQNNISCFLENESEKQSKSNIKTIE